MLPLRHVLIVDSDEQSTQHYTRAFRGRFETTIVGDSLAGIEVLNARPETPVVMADFDSPYLTGPELFDEIRQQHPLVVAVLTSTEKRISAAVEAVNRHSLFRLVPKPCPTNDLLKSFEDAVSQYELLTANERAKVELSASLVHILGELLGRVRPLAREKGTRLQELARLLSGKFPSELRWRVDATAVLSQFGQLGVSDAVIDKLESGGTLNDEERAEFAAHSQIGAQLLGDIEILGPVAEDLKNLAAARGSSALSAELVRVLVDYDDLTQSGLSDTEVLTTLYHSDNHYDEDMLTLLEETLVSVGEGMIFRMLPLTELEEGMVVREGIRAVNGNLVTGKDTTLTKSILLKVRNFSQFHQLAEPIPVLVPDRA